jgi:hypothetical protein
MQRGLLGARMVDTTERPTNGGPSSWQSNAEADLRRPGAPAFARKGSVASRLLLQPPEQPAQERSSCPRSLALRCAISRLSFSRWASIARPGRRRPAGVSLTTTPRRSFGFGDRLTSPASSRRSRRFVIPPAIEAAGVASGRGGEGGADALDEAGHGEQRAVVGQAADRRGDDEHSQRDREHSAPAEQVRGTPAQQQEPLSKHCPASSFTRPGRVRRADALSPDPGWPRTAPSCRGPRVGGCGSGTGTAARGRRSR